MFHIRQDIQPLTDFKRHTASFMKRLKHLKRPVILTVNGKAELVVQDADSYQALLELADRAESVSAVQEALTQSHRGEGVTLEKFDRRMRRKHGISR